MVKKLNKQAPQINKNPYNVKKADLGDSQIAHNPILNPITNYRYNKYLFNNNNNMSSSLKMAGSKVIC